MKTSFTRCIFFLFLLGMTTGLSAQMVFWGDQPGQGDFDGGLNGWVSNTVSTTGIDTTWEWVSNGLITGGVLSGQNVTIASPTASNGAMVFNGDKFSNAANGIPDPPYPQYIEELVSPTIDLSAVPAGTALAIEFSQVYYWFQAADGESFFSSYSISTDDGATWSEGRDCNTGAPAAFANSGVSPLNNTTTVRIPVALNAAGSSTVRIKFTFAGNYYYWALDDIKITERPGQDDMSVAPGWYATSPNKMIPVTQLEPMYFMTDVENFGGNTAENVVLNMNITDDSGANVYTGTEAYGTLIADSLDENRVFGGDFTPTSLGTYTATYEVSADAMDQNPGNNTLSYTWEVTEETFAKEDGASSVIQPADSNWDDGIARSWAYGNHFYIVNGDDLVANNAEFVINNADDAEDIPVYVKLYKWDAPVDTWATDPDNSDYTCGPDARTLVGRGTYIIQGNEDDDEFVSVALLDELSLLQGVTLEDNTHYILMLELIDSGNDDANVVQLGANNQTDYAPTNFTYQIAGMPRFGSMIGLNGSGSVDDATYNSTGFGPEIVPAVRLSVGEAIPSSTVDILEGINMNIFPSPADKDMTVEIELTESHNDATLSVIDATGKILSSQYFATLQSERISYNTTDWANGSYFLRIATKDGVKTKNFVVQH